MQPHDDNQRPSEGDTDGGRDAQWSAFFHAIGMAFAKVFNQPDGSVHLKNSAVTMTANLTGSGDIKG
jgi:hypothetical protein